MSTFQGIEMARKALFAQQGGLYTTGHNISNVNTPGYSRQRVAFNATTPFPMPSRVMPQIAGQLGTGVEIGVVERIRNQFLDFQYRTENSRLGYFDTKSEALSRMENLLNEPSDTGLTHTMDRFWQSLQDLATNPDNSGAREVVVERSLALAETFNYLSKSMQSIQDDLKEQINVNVDDINSLLRQINDLNAQIQKLEPHGLLTNDLYDERDRLIDELSENLNIRVTYTESSESALPIADGLASIEILDERGNRIGEDGVFLIDVREDSPTTDGVVRELSVSPRDAYDPIENLSIEGYDEANFGGVSLINAIKETGRLSALIESYGYEENGEVKGDYPFYLDQLDKMAQKFAEAFNEVHESGVDLNGDFGEAFFVNKDGGDDVTSITAENITINADILANASLIAAGFEGEGSRNGDNALELSYVFDDSDVMDGQSVRKFFTSVIGKLGVESQEAKRMKNNTEILQAQVEHERMSVSAVSLDEEISDLIKFQHAYNAAARNMTAVDEMIDRIINHMGLVGR